MKIRVLLVALLTTAISATGLQAQAAKDDQTPLGAQMEKMSTAFRAINRQIADPAQNTETLKQIAAMKAAAEEALKLEPARKAEQPADQQAKFVANYQDTMKAFIVQLGKIEAMIKANDNAGAQALVNQAKMDQKDAHTKYKIQKKKQ